MTIILESLKPEIRIKFAIKMYFTRSQHNPSIERAQVALEYIHMRTQIVMN